MILTSKNPKLKNLAKHKLVATPKRLKNSKPIGLECKPTKIYLKTNAKVFTWKIIIVIIAIACFSSISIYYVMKYFPLLSVNDFKLLYPTIIGSHMLYIFSGEYLEYFMDYNMSDIKTYEILEEIKSNLLFMDNQGSGNNIPYAQITQEHQYSNVPHVVQHDYRGIYNPPQGRNRSPHVICNPSERLSILNHLDYEARQIGFFSISNVNPSTDYCKVTFYQDAPDPTTLSDKNLLLKRLWEVFPHPVEDGNNRLDNYRLVGRIYHDIMVNSETLADWPYRSPKPDSISSCMYDPTKPANYYQPWASDIADKVSLFREQHSTNYNTRPRLDVDSTVFLTSFMNHHPDLDPSFKMPPTGKILPRILKNI